MNEYAKLIPRVGFLTSGRGSNMQAVLDAWKAGRLNLEPAVVVSNNPRAEALERAARENIPQVVLNSQTCAGLAAGPVNLDSELLKVLEQHRVQFVVLAGYMKKVGPETLERYRNRIINIHPALLPKFGGNGMYGRHVHEAVLEAGETVTGATVHLVNAEYDEGPILAQRQVPILDCDDPASLAARVLQVEHELLVETLARLLAEHAE